MAQPHCCLSLLHSLSQLTFRRCFKNLRPSHRLQHSPLRRQWWATTSKLPTLSEQVISSKILGYGGREILISVLIGLGISPSPVTGLTPKGQPDLTSFSSYASSSSVYAPTSNSFVGQGSAFTTIKPNQGQVMESLIWLLTKLMIIINFTRWTNLQLMGKPFWATLCHKGLWLLHRFNHRALSLRVQRQLSLPLRQISNGKDCHQLQRYPTRQ